MRHLTKTFVENRWYRKVDDGFKEVPRSETKEGEPIDVQCRQWIDATGHTIVHPGQLGMHTTWHGTHEDPYQLKCLTFGLTVLYQEANRDGRAEDFQYAADGGIVGSPAPAHTGPKTTG